MAAQPPRTDQPAKDLAPTAPRPAIQLRPVLPSGMASQDLHLACTLGQAENLQLPLGFCLGVNPYVLVVDTDNHRVVVYSLTTGLYASSFGTHGTGEGEFDSPRKVALMPQVVLKPSDNPLYVVCDRGTNRARLQLFTPAGVFVRAIPLREVELVSGLTCTQDRHIVLADSIRGEVIVLNEYGDTRFRFNCGTHVSEPGDIAVHATKYYVCDFQGHRIGVYNEEGAHVSTIGQELAGRLLNYPNGIDISDDGQVVVADSHGNQYHLNVFDSETGDLLASYRYPNYKVSGIVGLKLHPDGLILSLSKNNRMVLVVRQ